jgi:glycosyltransferase involved in cell wall biosynthesis
MKKTKKKHILFVVENKQIPLDTRVLKEAKALEEKGLNVSIICPNFKKEKKYHKKINNIEVFQYFCFCEGKSFAGILAEYSIAIFSIFFKSIKVYLRKPFHIVHLANPPDFLIFLFLPFKLFGVKIIFDHHDLSPELFSEKFGKNNLLFNLLLKFEKASYKLANLVITTNLSMKKTCTKRNKVSGKKVYIVRNGPDLNEISSHKTDIDFRKDKSYIIGYVGNIDKQDSLEKLVNSVYYIVKKRNFNDFRVLIIGDGTDRLRIEENIKSKELQDYFIFYGSEYNRKKLFSLLAKIDIGVEPSKETEKFDKSTSTKIMEYMAVGKPIIQYNTVEGKFTAGNASLFIKNNDEKAFGDAIISLLNDEKKRKKMGKYGKRRVAKLLQWDVQKNKLFKVFQNLIYY